MDNNVLQRLLKGFGANLYGQAVVVVIQLAGVPILLNYWHAQLYGEWLILFAIPSYLSMTDLGFAQSAGNDMTARVARGDKIGALTVFQSLAALVLFSAVVGLLLVGAAIRLLPLGSWVHFSGLAAPDVRWVLWFLAAEVLVKLADGINHAGFRATGDYAMHVAIYYSTLLAQHSSIWLLAAFGRGPVAAAAAFFIIRAAVTPAVALLLTRRHPWLHFGFAQARFAELRALLRPALANTSLPLAQALNVQGMVLVVGATLGALAVVTFSTLRTLTRLALQLVLTVSNAAEPELAAAYGSGDRTLLRTLYHHTLRAGFWLALAAALGLALTGIGILQFWTHGRVIMEPLLFNWLLASAVARQPPSCWRPSCSNSQVNWRTQACHSYSWMSRWPHTHCVQPAACPAIPLWRAYVPPSIPFHCSDCYRRTPMPIEIEHSHRERRQHVTARVTYSVLPAVTESH